MKSPMDWGEQEINLFGVYFFGALAVVGVLMMFAVLAAGVTG